VFDNHDYLCLKCAHSWNGCHHDVRCAALRLIRRGSSLATPWAVGSKPGSSVENVVKDWTASRQPRPGYSRTSLQQACNTGLPDVDACSLDLLVRVSLRYRNLAASRFMCLAYSISCVLLLDSSCMGLLLSAFYSAGRN
jgi:hypothetical protein